MRTLSLPLVLTLLVPLVASRAAAGKEMTPHGSEVGTMHCDGLEPCLEGEKVEVSMAAPQAPAHEHGHAGHNHNMAPLKEIDEDLVLETHSPSPLAYWRLEAEGKGHYNVLLIHIVFMSISFFFLLPLALFLKAAESSLSLLPQIGFIVTLIFGLIFGKVYNVAIGQDLYEHDAHSRLGWFVAVLACALSAHDVVKGAIQFREWYSGKSYHRFSGVPAEDGDSAERERFIVAEEEEMVESPVKEQPTDWGHVHFAEDRHARTMSMHSDDTVFDHSPRPLTPPSPAAPVTVTSLRARVVALAPGLITVVDRSLLILGYTCALSGIAVYTGTCRERYLNGCLAHTIKGSVFFWYGLLSFARYLGAYRALGWAWNRRPAGLAGAKVWSAEAVEALVIFTYGITNVWMELFMGEGGSISVHQVQHAGVALMFWFIGLLGVLLEFRRDSEPEDLTAEHRLMAAQSHPTGVSFNPFPALVIGLTGMAMSAHHQIFQLQVDIHVIWGQFLYAFAALRFLTYFFLYLRPPTSAAPSRPPTEALGSFFLTAGGVVFIFSTEEITLAAMRHDFADPMALMSVATTIVGALLSWTVVLFALKSWAQGPGKKH